MTILRMVKWGRVSRECDTFYGGEVWEIKPYCQEFLKKQSATEQLRLYLGLEFRHFPAEELTFIAFNNQNNGAYDDLRKNVVKLITGAR